MKVLQLAILLSIIFILSCNDRKTLEPAPINKLKAYVDEPTGFSVNYPEEWEVQSVSGKSFFAFSLAAAKNRFLKYDGIGDPVARLRINTLKLDSTRSFQDVIEGRLIFDTSIYKGPEKITIDGVTGISYTYGFELNDGKFQGKIIFATKDSVLATVFNFESFGNTWDTYKPKLDQIVNSFKLATNPILADTIYQTEETFPLPSATLVQKEGQGYTINIPDNFTVANYESAGAAFARKYEGQRRADSYIVVEVLKSSKKELAKIAEENAKALKQLNLKEVSVGSQKAYVIEYNATPKVKRKLYFMKKGETPYRIIMDYGTEEEKEYLPIFESVIKTFKMK